MGGATRITLHLSTTRPNTLFVTIHLYPAPADRVLHFIGEREEDGYRRVSSVTLYGVESARTHTFEWRLPAGTYVFTVLTVDGDGRPTGSYTTSRFLTFPSE